MQRPRWALLWQSSARAALTGCADHESNHVRYVVALVAGAVMFSQAKTVIVAIVLAVIAVFAVRWHLTRVAAAERAVHAHYAVVLGDIREKTAVAERAIRVTESAWRTAIDKEAEDGQTRIDLARRDAVAARASADGLRADVARYRAAARSATNSGVAAAGPTASGALDLLSDLFGRADEAAGELAEFADSAHAAGLTCQRSYNALTIPNQQEAGTTGSK